MDNDSSRQYFTYLETSLKFDPTETQHWADHNNKFAPMILVTENYNPSGTTQGSFEFKVFV